MFHCATVDGSWAQWGRFSPCSRRCSGGTQRRYRYCTNPRPSNGGKDCPGDGVEDVPCNTDPCAGEAPHKVSTLFRKDHPLLIHNTDLKLQWTATWKTVTDLVLIYIIIASPLNSNDTIWSNKAPNKKTLEQSLKNSKQS